MSASSTDALVRLDRVTALTPSGRVVLDGVDGTFVPGRVHAIVGPNGAGKTTLLDVVLGVRAPAAGSVTRHATCDAPRITDVPWSAHVLCALRASELVALPAAVVSRGERERVRLARTLSAPARLLVLDEVAVDASTSASVGRLLREAAQRGCSVTVATADLRWACRWADIVGVLADRRLTWDHPDDAIARAGLGRHDERRPVAARPRAGRERHGAPGAAHAARLSAVVRGRLGLDHRDRVALEVVPGDRSPTSRPMTVVRVDRPEPRTWFIERPLPELSPHELRTVLAHDPEGHTHALT